ncbi:MAG: hypothetical protein FWG84_00710 [Bacteroidales bacterium]|nr:hypothetical protein [Bacteroidales bacterium]
MLGKLPDRNQREIFRTRLEDLIDPHCVPTVIASRTVIAGLTRNPITCDVIVGLTRNRSNPVIINILLQCMRFLIPLRSIRNDRRYRDATI